MKLLLLAFLAVGQIVVKVQPTIVDPSERSHYEVKRAPSGMTVDGLITEKEWGSAPWTGQFTECFQPGDLKELPTRAKMLWDDRYLYVAFECGDPDIIATYTKRDDPIYVQDAVEVFIDPEGRGRHYFEIDVSPRNVAVDLLVIMAGWQGFAGRGVRYNVKGLLTGAKVYGTLNDSTDKDEKWTAEMAIPWADFMGRKVNVPPVAGDPWRINLFRVNSGEKRAPEDQYLSWSKSPGVFHQSLNFGVVTFRR